MKRSFWLSKRDCLLHSMHARQEKHTHTQHYQQQNIRTSVQKTSLPVVVFYSFLFYFFHSLLVFSSSTEMGIFRCMFRMYTVIVVLVRPVFMRSLCRDLPVCCVIVSVLVYNMNPTSTETKNFRLILLCVFSSASSIHS